MPTTPKHALPYPALTDSPDVPYWLQRLAEVVESKLLGQTSGVGKRVHVQTGLNGTTDATGYVVLNHGAPFTPRVVQAVTTANATSLGFAISSGEYTATTAKVRFASWSQAGTHNSASIGSVTLISWE